MDHNIQNVESGFGKEDKEESALYAIMRGIQYLVEANEMAAQEYTGSQDEEFVPKIPLY